MTSTKGNAGVTAGAAVYELAVEGALGPVLLRVLEPYARASLQVTTVLRARVPSEQDLVDVLRVLELHGMELSDISAVS